MLDKIVLSVCGVVIPKRNAGFCLKFDVFEVFYLYYFTKNLTPKLPQEFLHLLLKIRSPIDSNFEISANRQTDAARNFIL